MNEVSTLWTFLNWMSETVYTNDYLNVWFYDLVSYNDTVTDLLTGIGKELLEIFHG